MSDDIRPGDVVVCVDESDCRCCNEHFPACIGQMFRVKVVAPGYNPKATAPFASLLLADFPGTARHPAGSRVSANRFRKLPAADAEFTAQMWAMKPRLRSDVPVPTTD